MRSRLAHKTPALARVLLSELDNPLEITTSPLPERAVDQHQVTQQSWASSLPHLAFHLFLPEGRQGCRRDPASTGRHTDGTHCPGLCDDLNAQLRQQTWRGLDGEAVGDIRRCWA